MRQVFLFPMAALSLIISDVSCAEEDVKSKMIVKQEVVPVDPSHFISESLIGGVIQEERTLSDGSKVLCYVIKTYSKPHEHEMGPWAPKMITDGKESGGIWLKDGKVYDVDGPFIKNIAEFYKDPEWKLYNSDGSIRVTETKEAFEAAARPDVDARYRNHVVEGQPEWVAGKVTTYVIPVTPIILEEPISIGGGPGRAGDPPRGERGSAKHQHGGRPPRGGSGANGGNGRAGQGGIGLAFNGVNFDPPAPIQAIITAHTIAPFDDAGGHINPHEGYHYHAATGHTKEVVQPDGHAPMIGYALDGFGLFAHLDKEGNEAKELDECGGHYDEIRGYHYHVGSPGSNQIISAFRGRPGSVTVAD